MEKSKSGSIDLDIADEFGQDFISSNPEIERS